MPLYKRWLGREVTPDGEFAKPASFTRIREEDFKGKEEFRYKPLAIDAVVTVKEESTARLYRLIKPIEFSIRTTPW